MGCASIDLLVGERLLYLRALASCPSCPLGMESMHEMLRKYVILYVTQVQRGLSLKNNFIKNHVSDVVLLLRKASTNFACPLKLCYSYTALKFDAADSQGNISPDSDVAMSAALRDCHPFIASLKLKKPPTL